MHQNPAVMRKNVEVEEEEKIQLHGLGNSKFWLPFSVKRRERTRKKANRQQQHEEKSEVNGKK